jgi:hypothetical protein
MTIDARRKLSMTSCKFGDSAHCQMTSLRKTETSTPRQRENSPQLRHHQLQTRGTQLQPWPLIATAYLPFLADLRRFHRWESQCCPFIARKRGFRSDYWHSAAKLQGRSTASQTNPKIQPVLFVPALGGKRNETSASNHDELTVPIPSLFRLCGSNAVRLSKTRRSTTVAQRREQTRCGLRAR